MPAKSRHGGRKRYSQTKKKRSKQYSPGVITQQQADIQNDRSIAPPREVTPPTKAPAPGPTPAAVRHPYIATELRRIGILAGIILVILVMLALFLP